MKKFNTHLIAQASLVGLSALLCLSAAQAQQVLPVASDKVAPTDDSFYTSPSAASLSAVAPGTVLRYRALPASALVSAAKEGYQIMYRSNDSKDQPVAMVTTLLVPKNAPLFGRQLVSYQSFYDSLTLNCSPSGLTLNGKLNDKTIGAYQPALSKGVYVVMSDYEGLQSQWIAGRNTAHGVLDGIRAALSFTKTGLGASTRVGMLGYSGGGYATGFAAELAASYAPELKIVGAAQGGLPVNPVNVAKKVDGGLFAGAYLGALVGLSRAYPELDTDLYANADGKAALKDGGTRCLGGSLEGQPELLAKYAFKKGSQYFKDPNFLDLPEIQAINAENTMGQSSPKFPLMVFQGKSDELMPLADVDNLVAKYCAAGTKVQYDAVVGDHLTVGLKLTSGMNYVLDLLNGKAATNNCK